jgi:23S rRNA pseudouridine2605 synthase
MAVHPRDPSRSKASGQAEPADEDARAPECHERVARALARAGVASRRDAERLIEAGRVALNGEILTHPAVNVTAGDILTLDGEVVAEPEPIRVWRYHKPAGLLTAHKDPKGRPTVFDALPKAMGRVISVGRLDLASEGLLLLTNDGELTRALELPSTGWLRRYRARAYGRVNQSKLDALKHGVTIEGVHYGAIEAELEKSGGGSNVWITVGVREGKNREVRRVLEHLGLKVNRLIRTGYGPFELGDLEPGAVAEAPSRVIRELLGEVIGPDRAPRSERKLFNWTPERTRPERARSGPRQAASPPKTAPRSGRDADRVKPYYGKDGKPVRGEHGPSTFTSGRARAKPKTEGEAAKPEYKPGWARPKKAAPKARPKSGPRRTTSRPKGRS